MLESTSQRTVTMAKLAESSSATFLAPIPTLNSRRLNRIDGTQRSGTRTSSVTECEARTRTVSDCAWTEMQCTCTCVALVLVTRRASDYSLPSHARVIQSAIIFPATALDQESRI
eukprot:856565_1